MTGVETTASMTIGDWKVRIPTPDSQRTGGEIQSTDRRQRNLRMINITSMWTVVESLRQQLAVISGGEH